MLFVTLSCLATSVFIEKTLKKLKPSFFPALV